MYTLTPFERRSMELFDAFHDLENSFLGSRMPAAFGSFKTDIRDDGDRFTLEAELPGFDKEDLKLDIEGGTLTLTAEHTEEKTEGDTEQPEGEQAQTAEAKPQSRYIRRERSYGSYRRSFDLDGIDIEGIEAEYKNGILYVTLPKKQPETPNTRRLDIKG
ncbi:MAG: Hsp20/alpha crystallin family protein [Ruminococcus sp.]|nr:Hsp20/alpha crystallin family protein [Ruminococcus sp.]